MWLRLKQAVFCVTDYSDIKSHLVEVIDKVRFREVGGDWNLFVNTYEF